MKTKSNKSFSVRVNVENVSENPRCPHGPTLLFIHKDKRYFACSAYRSRKFCEFYMLEGKCKRRNIQKSFVEDKHVDRNALFNLYSKMKFTLDCDRCYCHSCNVLFHSSEVDIHKNHNVQNNLSFDTLINPSKLFKPLEDNKKEAQYLFSDESTKTTINILIENNIRNIMCIGTPRIHEYIKYKHKDEGMTSVLMDIDDRHQNFNASHEYFHYNMFNHHFFNNESKTEYLNFLQSCQGNICVTMDPPFGGRIEPLANTLHQITTELNNYHKSSEKLVLTILFMPYFMEPHIKNFIPELKMSDYQVSYENHQSFQNNFKNKNGSPVRFFTNISLNKITLEKSRDYKFCEICKKWVGLWNKHCDKCKSCTSKNGTTYLHCDECDMCVKLSWIHCGTCNRCHLKDAKCDETYKYDQNCFHCGISGHKKSECLQLQSVS